MEAAPTADVIIESSDYLRQRVGAETFRAMRRTMMNDPEKWARIEKRAAEIRERGEYGDGGK